MNHGQNCLSSLQHLNSHHTSTCSNKVLMACRHHHPSGAGSALGMWEVGQNSVSIISLPYMMTFCHKSLVWYLFLTKMIILLVLIMVFQFLDWNPSSFYTSRPCETHLKILKYTKILLVLIMVFQFLDLPSSFYTSHPCEPHLKMTSARKLKYSNRLHWVFHVQRMHCKWASWCFFSPFLTHSLLTQSSEL